MRVPRATAFALSACLAAAVCAGLGLTTATAHAAGVEVRYLEPERFTDIGRTTWERERVLQTMTAHLQKLGQALPPGQTLSVDVSDINLAGELRPWGWHELRVLTGQADWPTMTLRYQLREGERTLKSGDERLSELNYMQHLRGSERSGDELAFEKRMVKRWFDGTFMTP